MYPRQYHPYHLVDNSPWPILIAFAIMNLAIQVVNMLGHKNSINTIFMLIVIISITIVWWRDIIREAIGGFHTFIVKNGILIGFLLFLISEIILFVSLFWTYFHASLAPAIELGSIWPPIGIKPVNTWAIPLLGTSVLLTSGFILTEAHHATLMGNKKLTLIKLFYTIVLGVFFLYFQGNEYYWGEFTITDSVFGSIFYSTTGLHGLHVLIGVIFLIISFIRLFRDSVTDHHNLNYEFAIMYWHLVDIIWIFVFIFYYYSINVGIEIRGRRYSILK